MGRDAEAGDGREAHEGPVADEECGGDRYECSRAAGDEADETRYEVADGDAGEDAIDAKVSHVEVREGGEEHLDDEDGYRATEHVEGKGSLRIAAGDAAFQREDDGRADEEEEVGKDEIGKGESIPFCVIELRVDVAPVAGIVDENHEGDGRSE